MDQNRRNMLKTGAVLGILGATHVATSRAAQDVLERPAPIAQTISNQVLHLRDPLTNAELGVQIPMVLLEGVTYNKLRLLDSYPIYKITREGLKSYKVRILVLDQAQGLTVVPVQANMPTLYDIDARVSMYSLTYHVNGVLEIDNHQKNVQYYAEARENKVLIDRTMALATNLWGRKALHLMLIAYTQIAQMQSVIDLWNEFGQEPAPTP